MVSLAQRLEQLRTEHGMTRPALSAALGLPKNAIEKFESGRQTPTKEQQSKLAAFFGVSMLYLQGETDDPTRQDSWMTAALSDAEPQPVQPKRPPAPKPVEPSSNNHGTMVEAFLHNKAFQQTVQTMVRDFLRTEEGQELLGNIVRKEINKQKR